MTQQERVDIFSAEYAKFRIACTDLKRYHKDNDVVNMMVCNGEIIAYIEKMKELLIEDEEGKILQQVKDFKTDLYYLYDTFEKNEPNFVTGGNANIVLVYIIIDCDSAYELNQLYVEYLDYTKKGRTEAWISARSKTFLRDPLKIVAYKRLFKKYFQSDVGYDLTRFVDEDFLKAMTRVLELN